MLITQFLFLSNLIIFINANMLSSLFSFGQNAAEIPSKISSLALKPMLAYAPSHNSYISPPIGLRYLEEVDNEFDTSIEADENYFEYTDYILEYINETMIRCVAYFKLEQALTDATLETRLLRCNDKHCGTSVAELPLQSLCHFVEPRPLSFIFSQYIPFYRSSCSLSPGYFQFSNYIPTYVKGTKEKDKDKGKWKLITFLYDLSKKLACFNLFSTKKEPEHKNSLFKPMTYIKPVPVYYPQNIGFTKPGFYYGAGRKPNLMTTKIGNSYLGNENPGILVGGLNGYGLKKPLEPYL